MRKEIELSLTDRGKELCFILREMPATQLEKWLMRAVLLLSQSNRNAQSDTDDNALTYGVHKLFSQKGINALLDVDFEKAEPLIDELLTCVHRKIDSALMAVTPQNVDTFIEDVQTLFCLRMEVIKLNLDFFTEENLSTFPSNMQKSPQFDMRMSTQK